MSLPADRSGGPPSSRPSVPLPFLSSFPHYRDHCRLILSRRSSFVVATRNGHPEERGRYLSADESPAPARCCCTSSTALRTTTVRASAAFDLSRPSSDVRERPDKFYIAISILGSAVGETTSAFRPVPPVAALFRRTSLSEESLGSLPERIETRRVVLDFGIEAARVGYLDPATRISGERRGSPTAFRGGGSPRNRDAVRFRGRTTSSPTRRDRRRSLSDRSRQHRRSPLSPYHSTGVDDPEAIAVVDGYRHALVVLVEVVVPSPNIRFRRLDQ